MKIDFGFKFFSIYLSIKCLFFHLANHNILHLQDINQLLCIFCRLFFFTIFFSLIEISLIAKCIADLRSNGKTEVIQ